MGSAIDNKQFLRMSNTGWSSRVESRQILALLQVAYQLHGNRVYTLCLRLLGDVNLAETALVNVFIRFRKEMTRRWDESVIVNRLRELAIDKSLNSLWGTRIKKADDASLRPISKESELRKPVSDRRSKKLDLAKLNQVIAMLPNELRVVLVLHDFEGLNDQEISKYLRLPKDGIRTLLTRARLEIRRHLISLS